MKDGMLLYTKDMTENKKQLAVHEGPVFDVVDVNHTSETKDTQKSKQDTNERGPKASVVNYYPNYDIVAQPTELYEPYPILVHHWDEIIQFRERFNPSRVTEDTSDCGMNDTYEHLGLLLDFLEEKMGAKVREEQERWKQPIPKVSFEMIWLLLKPGIDVYEHLEEDGTKEPWIVSRVSFDIFDQSWDNYTVDVWYLGHDATAILPKSAELKINRFHGEKPIQELNLFPCEYYNDHKIRRNDMIERGKLFYRGYVMVDPAQALEDEPSESTNLEVLVDQKLSQLPLCTCARCSAIDCERNRPAKFLGYKRIAFKDTGSMTDHQYFICANAIKTFVLAVRQWSKRIETLLLSGFREPKWNPTLMDSLVLKDDIKQMLQNLSRLYIKHNMDAASKKTPPSDGRPRANPWTADYIEDKGKGLVVLLHGKPGVGKTYTAECIAHSMQRPLLSITCADIGVDPPEVEKKLRRWFKIARVWDAVLLIDEADIYFESRQTQDLERNNLVASFLRAIEYYDGILFLTTNRVGTSDEAVWSRIHATIYYDDFTDEQRQKIWNTYFDKLEQERGDEIRVLESAKDYVTEAQAVKDLKWNGREIRNAFQIAVNLAQAEDVRDSKGRFTVKRDHIKVTVDLLKDFENYMLKLHKKSRGQRAQIHGNRFDAYNVSNGPREEYH
ncbi:hypothetical protein N0V83_010379 [Neocucurbitaria cava]|uniref:AAA+ ATPase domain-containing protein n=1 Tax=Neocucurbitaria cava TaxID=798079 RepID=A0A9W8XYG3_9PLEO|nr:hypothetical protein N0V83_010379 [Neocucurbitaria cava]